MRAKLQGRVNALFPLLGYAVEIDMFLDDYLVNVPVSYSAVPRFDRKPSRID
jgi:hypothetical protein